MARSDARHRVAKSLVLTFLLAALIVPGGKSVADEKFGQPTPQPRVDLYGDPLPDGARVRLGTVRFRHDSNSSGHGAVLSPDNKRLVTIGNDIRAWDFETGKLLWRNAEIRDGRQTFFSPDGNRLACSTEKGIALLDAVTGKQVSYLDRRVTTFDYLPDGKRAVIAPGVFGREKGTPAVVDLDTGKEVLRLGESPENVLAFCVCMDNESVLAVIFDSGGNRSGRLARYSLVTGKQTGSIGIPSPIPTVHVAVSPDGRYFATGSLTAVELRDVKAGELVASLDDGLQAGMRRRVYFSPDGKLLASQTYDEKARESVIFIWDVATRKLLREIRPVNSATLKFSADNKTLVASTLAPGFYGWDVATGKRLGQFEAHENSIASIEFTRDGRTVLSSAGGDIRTWDAQTGRSLSAWRVSGWNKPLLVSRTNEVVSVDDKGKMAIHDLRTGRELRQWQIDPETGRRQNGYQMIELAADNLGKQAVSSTPIERGHRFQTWDLEKGNKIGGRDSHQGLVGLALMHDGKWLAGTRPTQNASGRVEMEKGRRTNVPEPVRDQLLVQDCRTAQVLLAISLSERTWHHVAISPDGQTVLTDTFAVKGPPTGPGIPGWAIDASTTLRAFETATGNECMTKKLADAKPTNLIYAHRFSPDGRYFAVALREGLHLVFDAITGKEIWRHLYSLSEPRSIAFSPDSTTLAVGYRDSTILLWDLGQLRDPSADVAPPSESVVRSLLDALAGADARKARLAIGVLSAFPDKSLPALRQRLGPALATDTAHVAQLLADLDSASYSTRERASRELAQLGEEIVPTLEKALRAKPSAEVRQRVETLLAEPRVVKSPVVLGRIRAIQVLERIGSKEARELLALMASGAPESRETRDAQAALGRLASRQSAKP